MSDSLLGMLIGGCLISIAIGFKTHSIPNAFIGIGISLIIIFMLEGIYHLLFYKNE